VISLSWNSSFEPNSFDGDRHIKAMMEAYRALPKHIARKHIMASMRKVLKPGIPILKRNTPKGRAYNTRADVKRDARGRFQLGSGKKMRVRGGALRRAATVRTGQTGKNGAFDSFVWGVLGYKAGIESRKAIWLQFGTSRGVKAYQMMEKTLSEFGPIASSKLAAEMAVGLEKAAAELAAGKNKGYGG
jgi:hypothetical protein